jgi:hypothetical protein
MRTLDSGALRVLVVDHSDPLPIHLVIFLIINSGCVEDIGSDELVLHQHIRIHDLQQRVSRRRGGGGEGGGAGP